MEDCTRVVLYGTFDGAAFSTDNFLQIAVILDSGEKVEIPTECVTSADQIVKKDEIKLKDVIKRIEKFDLGTKAVWINEILNELGSDYGAFKYKAGYEQGKFDSAVEREKVTIPQFVADWIEYCKRTGVDLYHALEMGDLYFGNYANQKDDLKLKDFFEVEGNQELFARAWLDGYEVEEKRYMVRMKGVNDYGCYLNKGLLSKKYFWESKSEIGGCRTKHTRKQLEDDDFGWVFDCPGMEVEEVE